MNKVAIIAGICGLAAGATGGYLACHFIEKGKIDKAISDGIQQALDEIRGHQKQKAMENEKRKQSREINAIPHFNAIDIAKDIAKESGYVTDEVKEPEGSPDDDEDPDHAVAYKHIQVEKPLPFDTPESDETTKDVELLDKLEHHNIWDEKDPNVTQEEYDEEQEPDTEYILKTLDPKKAPYVITADQYNNELSKEVEEGFWEKVTLIFFTDNVFAERVRINELQTMSDVEIQAAIGKNNMTDFVTNRDLKRMFVRNNKLHLDYEIVRSPRSYSSAMNDEDEE